MEEKIIKINPEIFERITEEISYEGNQCLFDRTIMNYLYHTREFTAGNKLANYIDELCKTSITYNKHISKELPLALNKLKETLINLDQIVADNFRGEEK